MTLERMTLAEIAQGSLAAVRVLEEHALDYCADGQKTLADACAGSNLDPKAILQQLSNAKDPDDDDRDWTSEPLRDLLAHLIVEDHAFFRAELGVLTRRMAAVDPAHHDLGRLPVVFRTLAEDLEMHMRHEENEVFPAISQYIEAVEQGTPLRGSPLAGFGGHLRVMEMEHETTGAALRLIREFADDYQVDDDACARFRALVDGLRELEDRLLRHMYLENNVLYPRAVALKAPRQTVTPQNSVA